MANHKSALKRGRQNIKKQAQNKWKVSRMRTALKALKELTDKKDKEGAQLQFKKVQSLIAKLAKGPVLKRFRPRSQGRAFKILKPTCHLTIELEAL